MGKGDKKTRRGKIFMGSFGKTRPQKPNKNKVKVEVIKPKAKKGKQRSTFNSQKPELKFRFFRLQSLLKELKIFRFECAVFGFMQLMA